jgi:UDP-N-acetylglucosamine 2-epimerase (non-hydrolysing)
MLAMRKKVLVAFGTRPEVIKMAPVIEALRARPDLFEVKVLSSGQHREMLTPILRVFSLVPDIELNVMQDSQGPMSVISRVLQGMEAMFSTWRPDWVLIHGDTATSLAAGLASFYADIPCGHVEAGLRSGDLRAPWPEEMHRLLLSPMMRAHFPPTEHARQNLLRERISDESILVTGNTVIDALHRVVAKLKSDRSLSADIESKFDFLDTNRKLLLVTGHRRENFGAPLNGLCEAMRELALRTDVQLVYAVHLNPQVRDTVNRVLGNSPAVLIEPQEYLSFVYLMMRSEFIISDSGGIQEEAPSLGKPVLVTRETTERVEALQAGTIKLVGTDGSGLYREASKLLDDPEEYRRMSQVANPYGDGKAGPRIAEWLARA